MSCIQQAKLARPLLSIWCSKQESCGKHRMSEWTTLLKINVCSYFVGASRMVFENHQESNECLVSDYIPFNYDTSEQIFCRCLLGGF
jgi:hypothetical protein